MNLYVHLIIISEWTFKISIYKPLLQREFIVFELISEKYLLTEFINKTMRFIKKKDLTLINKNKIIFQESQKNVFLKTKGGATQTTKSSLFKIYETNRVVSFIFRGFKRSSILF